MSLTGKDITEIARLLDESSFSSLDLQMGDFRLRIRRGGQRGGWHDEDDGGREAGSVSDETTETAEPGVEPAPAQPPAGVTSASDKPAGAGEVDVVAPLLGNFYITPRPGEPPFVEVGNRVVEETIVGIIEVMKLMNSVRAGVAGTVTAIMAENGKPVEEGQPIIRVKVDA